MQVNSINATCQNSMQNFGALRLSLNDAHQLKLMKEDHLPGSLRFIMNKLQIHKALRNDSYNQLLASLGQNDIVLQPREIIVLKAIAKQGNDILVETIQSLTNQAKPLNLRDILPEGMGLVQALLKKHFGETIPSSLDNLKALNGKISEFRAARFKQAEEAPIKTDFDSATPTAYQWGRRLAANE